MIIHLKNKLKFYLDIFLKTLYPNKCLCCNRNIIEEGFCLNCFNKRLQIIKKPYCSICSEEIVLHVKNSTDICPNCISKEYYFDKALSVFKYNDSIAQVIHNFKFNEQFFLAKYLSIFLLEKIKEFDEKIDYIIPIPIHLSKLRIRGYNQTVLLAKEFEKNGYKNILYRGMIKIKKTVAQSNLNFAERNKNLKTVFKINVEYSECLKNKNILILDDIFTTGTTVNECAKVLKKNSANKVFVLSLAKTTLNKN